MEGFQSFDNALLDGAGLNLHAVFNIDRFPSDVLESLRGIPGADEGFGQLILIGHAGRRLWDCVKKSGIDSENPIDQFTIETVKRWFAEKLPNNAFRIIYPGGQSVGLQRLGQLAGWHNPSPFMVGIDPAWGTWYAYRAAVLADTGFEPTQPVVRQSPCTTCQGRPCIPACPGKALERGRFELDKCVAYRRQAGSACAATCLARVSCPVGVDHRYCDEQLHHTYSNSLRDILRYF